VIGTTVMVEHGEIKGDELWALKKILKKLLKWVKR
jgi:hypothetical protein